MAKLVRTGTETLKRRCSLLHRQWHSVGEGLEAKVTDGRVFIRDQKTKAERVSVQDTEELNGTTHRSDHRQ